ncbi:MAG: creatininase family protein [Bacillota bacterium]
MPLEYVDLTLRDLPSLDRDKTVFFMSVSPIEVHGPHLPLGTDVMVAEEVRKRVQNELGQSRPDLTLVNMPPLYCGSDALPVLGSISVQAGGLSSVLYDYARALSRQGFKYLVILDNHGGPRHHMGIDAAARRAWSKHRFHLIDPFIETYKRMIRHDPALLSMTGLKDGACGDDADNHAGTNETSLMLAIYGEGREIPGLDQIPASLPSQLRGVPRLVDSVGAALHSLGATHAGTDLKHLAQVLAWTGKKGFLPYMGAPSAATREAGEAMFRAHVKITIYLLERALAGESGLPTPVLSSLSFLRRLPE